MSGAVVRPTVGRVDDLRHACPSTSSARRTSEKWRHYPPDVLPLFVAEMDVPQAEPVIRAVHDAMRRGDTGYPSGTATPRRSPRSPRERWGWDGRRRRARAWRPT